MHGLGILTRLIKLFITPYKEENKKEEYAKHKKERYEIAEDIRYINFSGDYDKFDQCTEKNKASERHKGTLKYLTKKWDIPKEEYEEADVDLLKIYDSNSKEQGVVFLKNKPK